MSDNANNFFEDLARGINGNISVAKIGKIVDFEPERMKCSVMPLPTEDNAIILNVPVMTIKTSEFLIYYPLKPDDYVILLFIDNDTDAILMGGDNAQTERMHDVSDCVAIGGITLLNDSLNIEDTDSLCIQNIDKTASIVVKKDGDINIKAKHFKVEAERIDLN